METVKEKKPAMGKNIEEMMTKYRELGTPGAPHKMLGRNAGKWITRARYWSSPDTPPFESSGTSEQEMILGGRFLLDREMGDMRGTPFTGLNITGYDKAAEKYFTVWLDSTSTRLSLFEGSAGADGRTITMMSTSTDPVWGIRSRTITRFIDEDSYVFEMYGIDKNGVENKMMEIMYSRQK